jgi:competence protein ComEA
MAEQYFRKVPMREPTNFLCHLTDICLFVTYLSLGQPSVSRADAAITGQQPTVQERSAKPLININIATESELEQLPNIGPSRAAAIVALRKKLGQFKRTSDLIRVKGIGQATMRKLAPLVTVK